METPKSTESVTISLGGEDLVFDLKHDNLPPESVQLVGVKSGTSNFKFEFHAALTDQLEVKKYTDPQSQKHFTEIWVSRGLGNITERFPLVRIVR
jgi:hypothetical protein